MNVVTAGKGHSSAADRRRGQADGADAVDGDDSDNGHRICKK